MVTAVNWLLKHSSPGTTIARDPLEGFMFASQMGIMVLDGDGVIVSANEEVATLFERTPQEIESRQYADAAWRLTNTGGDRLAEHERPHGKVLDTTDSGKISAMASRCLNTAIQPTGTGPGLDSVS